MKRRVAAITGNRSDYGLMRVVYEEIGKAEELELDLIVTGAHLLPEFRASLEQVEGDAYGRLHRVSMALGEDSGKAMAQSLGLGVFGIAGALEAIRPQIVLLQGDRGEMLAGAIAAAHMNLPIVHMSGGDFTGSIDDSIRNAISKFAHVHLTICRESSERLLAMGEAEGRIAEVGEPALDAIRRMDFIPAADLAQEFAFDPDGPLILATQHPVTTEAEESAQQMTETMEALAAIAAPTILTYPNNDAGGRAMVRVIDSYRDRPFLRVVPHLGSRRYLSLLRQATVLVGNSSSGIVEAPSFKLAAVNIGTRQHGRVRANNVVDAGHDRQAIADAIRFAMSDTAFRRGLRQCVNPYGDGHAAERTVAILRKLPLTPGLVAKWLPMADGLDLAAP
jgi:UDP-N-acetylglucosamine 2-epimerase (non-hydrolysing)/GDP/UDP-N,N'-diacetylbacillosamine 2-epimerase (hydrolysing)